MHSIEHKILTRIRKHGRGWCFTPRSFAPVATPEAVWKSLTRLEQKGRIRRLGHGLYDFPREHHLLGKLSPTPEAIARAIAERDSARIQPGGAYAANLLGLTEQVPAKPVFLTSGPYRKIPYGGGEIILKHTAPRFIATAGTTSGLVIHALRYIGHDQITPEHLATLRANLTEDQRKKLWDDRVHAPVWMHHYLKAISGIPND